MKNLGSKKFFFAGAGVVALSAFTISRCGSDRPYLFPQGEQKENVVGGVPERMGIRWIYISPDTVRFHGTREFPYELSEFCSLSPHKSVREFKYHSEGDRHFIDVTVAEKQIFRDVPSQVNILLNDSDIGDNIAYLEESTSKRGKVSARYSGFKEIPHSKNLVVIVVEPVSKDP